MTPENYIKTYIGFAKEVQTKYKIPYIFALAQSALESQWGAKIPGNNYFGIRANKSWTGKIVPITTHEVINGKSVLLTGQAFRAYNSAEDSFLNWGGFLTGNPRYSAAFKLTGDSSDVKFIKEFAKTIADAGYSTAPTYFKLLSDVIDSVVKRV